MSTSKASLPTTIAQTSTSGTQCMSIVALVLLVLQNFSQFLMLRASRKGAGESNKVSYSPSTAVICQEVIKTVISFIVLSRQIGSVRQAYQLFKLETIDKPTAVLKLAVPSLLYTLQNTLIFVAMTHLEAAVAQILYQCKIISAAIFSVTMLGRSLSTKQWLSLVLLATGAAIVQYTSSSSKQSSSTTGTENPVFGFMAVMAAVTTSGFCGCYIERILKQRTQDPSASPLQQKFGDNLWLRNTQLSAISIPIAFGGLFLNVVDLEHVREHGFFGGYSPLVWAVVGNIAAGGLLVAMVMKYASNIAKGFATTISIVLSALTAVTFQGKSFSAAFLFGAVCVLFATFLYSTGAPRPQSKPTSEIAEEEKKSLLRDA